jgi:hypothetical protein
MTDQQTAMQRYTAEQAELEDAARDVVRVRDQIDRYGPHGLPPGPAARTSNGCS